VRIDTMPSGYDAASLLDHIRTNLNDFVDTSKSKFLPYSPGVDDAQWSSSAPVGAVYKIIIPKDNGAVVGSLVETLRWRFTTVHTPDTGDHPVSGHREFGMSDAGAAATFYTRAADRTTGLPESLPLINRLAWAGADALWRSLQQKLADFVNSNGGSASIRDPFSQRFNWSAAKILVTQNGGARTDDGDGVDAAAAALSADDLASRADAASHDLGQAVRDALAQGQSEHDISDFLDQMGVPAASPTGGVGQALSAYTLEDGGQHYTLPAPLTTLDGWKAKIATVAIAAAFGALAPIIATLPAIANASNCCIGVGPAVEIGALEGGGLGAGVIFAPGGKLGTYFKTEETAGLQFGISAVCQFTVKRGALNHYRGAGYAIAIKGGEAPVAGLMALLDENRNFEGVTFQAGLGLGSPVEVLVAAEKTYATAEALAAAPPPPRRRLKPHLAQAKALDGSATTIAPVVPGTTMERITLTHDGATWELDQLHGFKRPPNGGVGSLQPQPAPTIRLEDWPFLQAANGEPARAGVVIDWRYDGAALGDIAISPGATNVPGGWSVHVAATIDDDLAASARPDHAGVASLAVCVRHVFTKPDQSTTSSTIELRLFGDGTIEQDHQWDKMPAPA
jgi:hypothetical protein